MPELPLATVTRRKDLSHELMLLWIEPETPFTFKPGQYCTIGLEKIERAYSIVSGPHEPAIELFVELVPDGPLSSRLWNLREGDKVSIRPRAKGLFLMDRKYTNHFMVSTVTGVVPFVSMLRSYLHRGDQGHHFYILQGASYQDEFGYREELEALASSHPDAITYVPTVSRPQEERNLGWTGVTGRVNLIVEEYLDRFGLSSESTLVYACGHPGMIEDVKERVTPKGFKVMEERFWKQ
jgi:NAD(P)H-flavin reductase